MSPQESEKKSFQEFEALLETSPARAASYLDGVHAADVADWLSEVEEEDLWLVFSALGAERQAEVLEFAGDELTQELVGRMSARRLATVVEHLPSDEAVDLLADADERVAQDVLAAMEPETADELRNLASYDPESAGGIMGTEFATVPESARLGDAVKALRKLGIDAEEELDIFVVDDGGRPVGYLPDRVLLTHPIHTPVSEAMVEPLTIEVQADQEDAARTIDRYGLSSLGVVDDEGRLIGVVSAEDAAEILSEETEEDILRLVGAEPEALQTRMPVLRRVRHRLPLMGLTVGAGLLNAHLLGLFFGDGSHTEAGDVLRFLPMILGLAGNVGLQSSTILVRAFATGELDERRQLSVLGGEVSVGAVIGLVCGVVIACAVGWAEGWPLGLAVGVATVVAISNTAFLGCMIPLACRRLGLDPAIAAGPTITSLSDLLGAMVFLLVALQLL